MKKFLMLALPAFSLFSYSAFADETADAGEETVATEEVTEVKDDKNA